MPRKKILALHGVAQSGPVFYHRRIKAIVDTLATIGYDIIPLTAPFDITNTPYTVAKQHDYQDGDLERSWWETDDSNKCHYGIEIAFELWGNAMKEHGSIAGVLGFSQGGCGAASIAAMLEPSRRSHPLFKKYMPDSQPPLEFCIMFSGNPYRYADPTVQWLFYPEAGGDKNVIETRVLAFYGQKEWRRVESQRNRQAFLISRCSKVTVIPHPWEHTVPRTQEYADIVKAFVLNATALQTMKRPNL